MTGPGGSSPASNFWSERQGDGPLVAVAVHAGSAVRPSLHDHLALDAAGRLREEDPFTDRWAHLAPTWLVGERSRFEVDLNRPPERAVYRSPEDAWGLEVWNKAIPEGEVDLSLALHADFYRRLGEILDEKVERYGGFVLLDLHSYNHRRESPEGPAADPAANPEVNLGTGTLDRGRWGELIDRFIADLADSGAVPGGDVRENVKFRGGQVPLWTHTRYPERGVALAVEFKKTFMDEWSGAPDEGRIAALSGALRSTFPGLLASLRRVIGDRGGDA